MAYDQLKLHSQLCFRLYTASRLITQTYYPLLDKLGITYPQYLVLMVLWEEDGLKVMELARRLYLDSNTMTPLVQRMEKVGLVDRVKSEEDARETFVSLTKHGKELEEMAKDIPFCMVDKELGGAEGQERIKPVTQELDGIIARLSDQRTKAKEAAYVRLREERATLRK